MQHVTEPAQNIFAEVTTSATPADLMRALFGASLQADAEICTTDDGCHTERFSQPGSWYRSANWGICQCRNSD